MNIKPEIEGPTGWLSHIPISSNIQAIHLLG